MLGLKALAKTCLHIPCPGKCRSTRDWERGGSWEQRRGRGRATQEPGGKFHWKGVEGFFTGGNPRAGQTQPSIKLGCKGWCLMGFCDWNKRAWPKGRGAGTRQRDWLETARERGWNQAERGAEGLELPGEGQRGWVVSVGKALCSVCPLATAGVVSSPGTWGGVSSQRGDPDQLLGNWQ